MSSYGEPFGFDHRRNVALALSNLYCGCGNPESAIELVHDLLTAAPFYENRDRVKELLPTTGIEMVVFYALESAELIEHGSSIGGSWLTERGKEALAGLRAIRDAEGFEGFDDVQRCVHGIAISDECEGCR